MSVTKIIFHDSDSKRSSSIQFNPNSGNDNVFLLPEDPGTLATTKSLDKLIPINTPSILNPANGEYSFSGSIRISEYSPKSIFKGHISHTILQVVKLTKERLELIAETKKDTITESKDEIYNTTPDSTTGSTSSTDPNSTTQSSTDTTATETTNTTTNENEAITVRAEDNRPREVEASDTVSEDSEDTTAEATTTTTENTEENTEPELTSTGVPKRPMIQPRDTSEPYGQDNPLTFAKIKERDDNNQYVSSKFDIRDLTEDDFETLFASPDIEMNLYNTYTTRLPKLEASTHYLIRAAHVATNGMMSAFSKPTHFQTSYMTIVAPTLEYNGLDENKIEGEASFRITNDFKITANEDTHELTKVIILENNKYHSEFNLRPGERDFRLVGLKSNTPYSIEVYYKGQNYGIGQSTFYRFTTADTKIDTVADGLDSLKGGSILYGHYGEVNSLTSNSYLDKLYNLGRWEDIIKIGKDNTLDILPQSLIKYQNQYYIFNARNEKGIKAFRSDIPSQSPDRYTLRENLLIPSLSTVAFHLGFNPLTNDMTLTDANLDGLTTGYHSVSAKTFEGDSLIKCILMGKVRYLSKESLFDKVSVNDLFKFNLVNGKRTLRLMNNLYTIRIMNLEEFRFLVLGTKGDLGETKVNFSNTEGLHKIHIIYDNVNNRIVVAKVLPDGTIGASNVTPAMAKDRELGLVKIAIEPVYETGDLKLNTDISTVSIGPKAETEAIEYDPETDTGIFTSVSRENLPPVNNIVEALNLNSGRVINSETDFKKVYYQGDILFISNKPVLFGIDPADLNKLGALHRNMPLTNNVNPVITYNNVSYKICSIDGAANPIISGFDYNYSGQSLYNLLLRLTTGTSNSTSGTGSLIASLSQQIGDNFTDTVSNNELFDLSNKEITSTIVNTNVRGGITKSKVKYLVRGGNNNVYGNSGYDFTKPDDAGVVLNNGTSWRVVLKVLSKDEASLIKAKNDVIQEQIDAEEAREAELQRIEQEETQKHQAYQAALLIGKHATATESIVKPIVLHPANNSEGYYTSFVFSKYIKGKDFNGDLTSTVVEMNESNDFTRPAYTKTFTDSRNSYNIDDYETLNKANKTIYIRVKHVSEDTESEWSDIVSFNTPSVSYGDFDIGLNQVLQVAGDNAELEYMGALPSNKLIKVRRYRGDYNPVSMLSDISNKLDYRCHFYGLKIKDDKYFEHPNGYTVPTYEEKDLRANTEISYFKDDVISYMGKPYYALRNVPPGVSPVHPEASTYWKLDDRVGLPSLDDLILRQLKMPVGVNLQITKELQTALDPNANIGMFSNNVENITWAKMRINEKTIFVPMGMPVHSISYQHLADRFLIRKRRTIRLGEHLFYIRVLTLSEYKVLLTLANKDQDGVNIRAFGLNAPEWIHNPDDQADPLTSSQATVTRSMMPGNSYEPRKVNITRVKDNQAGYRPILEYIPPHKEPRHKAHIAVAGIDQLPTIQNRNFQYDFYTDTGNFGIINGSDMESIAGVPKGVEKWFVNYYHGMILVQGINKADHQQANLNYNGHTENTTLNKVVTNHNVITLSTGLKLLRFIGEIGVRKGETLTESIDNLHKPIVSTQVYDGLGSRDTIPETLYDATLLRCISGLSTEYGYLGNPSTPDKKITTALSTGNIQVGNNWLNIPETEVIPSSRINLSTHGVKLNYMMGELPLGSLKAGDASDKTGTAVTDIFMQTPSLGYYSANISSQLGSLNNSPAIFKTEKPEYVDPKTDVVVDYDGTKPALIPTGAVTRTGRTFKPNLFINTGSVEKDNPNVLYQGVDFMASDGLGSALGEILEFSYPKPLQVGSLIGYTGLNDSMYSLSGTSSANDSIDSNLVNTSLLRYYAAFKPDITGRTANEASATGDYFTNVDVIGGWIWCARDNGIDKARTADANKLNNFRTEHIITTMSSNPNRHKNQMYQSVLIGKEDIITKKYDKAFDNVLDNPNARLPMKTNIALLSNIDPAITENSVDNKRATFLLDYTQTAYCGAKLPDQTLGLQVLPNQETYSTTGARKIPEEVLNNRRYSWDIVVNIKFYYPSFEYIGVVGSGFIAGINGKYIGNGHNIVESHVGSSKRVRLYGVFDKPGNDYNELGYTGKEREEINDSYGEAYRSEMGVTKHVFENDLDMLHSKTIGRLMAPKSTRLMSRFENNELGSILNKQSRTFITQHAQTKTSGSAEANGLLNTDVVISDNAITVAYQPGADAEHIEGYLFSSSHALKKYAGYVPYFFNLMLPIDVSDDE